jgi:ABC-type transport system involved in multi-copper enzyme maturation permease subunit
VIAGKTWREIRVMALVYLAILELLLIPVILLWPNLYGDLQRSAFLRSLPIDFAKRIGEGISNRDEDIAYRNWMALMLYFRSVNLAGIAASVLLGTALFARERENQTLEFLLARPVSRARILFDKSWPTVLCVAVPVFLANWTAIFWSRQIDLDLPFDRLTLCSLHGALFVLTILAFTTWVSVLCRVQAHVAFWVGGIIISQIGIYLTQRLRRASLFRLSDYDWYGPLMAGNVRLADMFDPIGHAGLTTWLLLAIALFYGLALRALRRLEP